MVEDWSNFIHHSAYLNHDITITIPEELMLENINFHFLINH